MGVRDKVIRKCCYKLKQTSGLVKTSPYKAWTDLEIRVVNLKGSLWPVTSKTIFTELEGVKSACAITSSCIKNSVLNLGQKKSDIFHNT